MTSSQPARFIRSSFLGHCRARGGGSAARIFGLVALVLLSLACSAPEDAEDVQVVGGSEEAQVAVEPSPQVAELVETIQGLFAQQPADVEGFFALIHVEDAAQQEVVRSLAGMLASSTRLRHAVVEAYGEPLPSSVAPTIEIAARADAEDPERIVLVDETGQETVSSPAEHDGRWMLGIDALGNPFEQQLEGPQAAEISDAARRMMPAFDAVADAVQSGEIDSIEAVAGALQSVMMRALQAQQAVARRARRR
ncbi:MAG: hypothetical protein AAF725_28005, partial [Acidobacteriota bacterium]